MSSQTLNTIVIKFGPDLDAYILIKRIPALPVNRQH